MAKPLIATCMSPSRIGWMRPPEGVHPSQIIAVCPAHVRQTFQWIYNIIAVKITFVRRFCCLSQGLLTSTIRYPTNTPVAMRSRSICVCASKSKKENLAHTRCTEYMETRLTERRQQHRCTVQCVIRVIMTASNKRKVGRGLPLFLQLPGKCQVFILEASL